MYYDADGNAVFNGFELITGTINEQRCNLVLKHDGKFASGVASSEFIILVADKLDMLEGKTGTFTSMEGGQAQYQIG